MTASSEISILDSISSSAISNLTGNILEIALDQFLENDIVKSIPIVSTILQTTNAVIAIRDRLFIRKVCVFLLELKDTSVNDRIRFLKQLEDDIGRSRAAGEAILTIIDQADRVEKSAIIGKLFRAAVEGILSSSEVLHLSFIINQTYIGDIINLKTKFDYFASSKFNINAEHEIDEFDYEDMLPAYQRLAATGLLTTHLPTNRENKNQHQAYLVSRFGKILLREALLSETERCCYCHGEGKALSHKEEDWSETEVIPCKYCNGKGHVLPRSHKGQ